MERKIKSHIRQAVKEFGLFDGLYFNSKTKFCKKLKKILLKKNYTDEVDNPRILEILYSNGSIIECNKKIHQSKVFSRLYNRIPRNEYKVYKDEILEYIYMYIDLYMVFNLEEFITKSKKQLEKKK